MQASKQAVKRASRRSSKRAIEPTSEHAIRFVGQATQSKACHIESEFVKQGTAVQSRAKVSQTKKHIKDKQTEARQSKTTQRNARPSKAQQYILAQLNSYCQPVQQMLLDTVRRCSFSGPETQPC